MIRHAHCFDYREDSAGTTLSGVWPEWVLSLWPHRPLRNRHRTGVHGRDAGDALRSRSL